MTDCGRIDHIGRVYNQHHPTQLSLAIPRGQAMSISESWGVKRKKTHRATYGLYGMLSCSVWLMAKEMGISAALWASWLGRTSAYVFT